MGPGCRTRICFCLAIFFSISFPGFAASAPTITLSVDATDAPRKMFHAQLRIPAKPGTLTLYYPKWIPGEHGPTGPITDLTGLKFTASGKPLAWRRDLLDGFTFHVDVPAGETEVVADLDYASATSDEPGYSSSVSATEKLYILSWNTLLLYPAGYASDQLTYSASLRLPAGWKFGTSLHVITQANNEIKFAPVSLTMLVDGPVLTGEYMKVVPLTAAGENSVSHARDIQ